MKFRYLKTEGMHQPVIPVTLFKDGVHTATEALVDSGANASIFHAEYAEDLGLTLTDGDPVSFIGIVGPPLRAYRHELTVEIGGNRFDLPIALSADMSIDGFNILGQLDFFALFPIKFTFEKKEIHLMSPLHT